MIVNVITRRKFVKNLDDLTILDLILITILHVHDYTVFIIVAPRLFAYCHNVLNTIKAIRISAHKLLPELTTRSDTNPVSAFLREDVYF